jgi:gluconokinase
MIVVVIGPSGAGKTTVGRELADALGWTFYEGDDFHPPANISRMKAGVPLTDADRAPWLAALAKLIARHVAAGTSAVLTCSALKRAYRAMLVPTADVAAEVRFVYLCLTREALAARLKRRRGHFFSASLLESQLKDLEEPSDDEPSPVLAVDATEPPGQIVSEICDKLGL